MANRKPTSREMADRQFQGMKIAGEYLRNKEETARARKRLEDAGFDVEEWMPVLVGGEESHDELVRSTCPSAESIERILDED